MKELIGKTIRKVFVESDQNAMIFDTSDGLLRFATYGDCCSETWFSDIYNFDALLGTVASVEDLELPDYNVNDGRGRQEEDSAYGLKITTNKGDAKIVYRNSSNGYYGGSCDRGVDIAALTEDAIEITSDWSA